MENLLAIYARISRAKYLYERGLLAYIDEDLRQGVQILFGEASFTTCTMRARAHDRDAQEVFYARYHHTGNNGLAAFDKILRNEVGRRGVYPHSVLGLSNDILYRFNLNVGPAQQANVDWFDAIVERAAKDGPDYKPEDVTDFNWSYYRERYAGTTLEKRGMLI